MYRLKKHKIISRFKLNNKKNIRQKYDKLYYVNGSIYFCKTEWLIKNKKFINSDTYGYLIPELNSLDIDNYHDLEVAKNFLK